MKTKFIGIALVFTLLASFLGACSQTDSGGGGASPSPAESPTTSPATSPTTSPTTSP